MKLRKNKRVFKKCPVEPDSDDRFAFIAGYTEGGFPYGVTWEEMQEDAQGELSSLPQGKEARALDVLAPDLDDWPESWMGAKEDFEYGRNLLCYFGEFLLDLYEEGFSKKTFVQYRDNLWLLGCSIIRCVSNFEEYHINPLDKLTDAVAGDGILPDHFDQMTENELRAFSRMCRRLEKFLRQKYGVNF
jgi:hypothetical protein